MPKYGLLIEYEFCVGCHTCELSCKQEHDLHGGFGWIKMVDTGAKDIGGKLKRDFVPTVCLHCGDPPCRHVCPSEAIKKDANGIVSIEERLCTGCKLCLTACPVAALYYNHDKEVAEKCDLCTHLITRGLEPACVRNCPTEALYFGQTNAIINRIRERRIQSLFTHNNQVVYAVPLE